MKRLFSLVCAVLMIFALPISASSAFAFRNIEPGDDAPDFTLPSLEGKQVSLNSYSGKIVVLLFWAADVESKKSRSIELLRTLEGIHQEHGKSGVVALAVNFDRDKQNDIAAIVEQAEATFPTLLDEDGVVYGSYGVFILPTVGVIGKDGKLRKAFGYTHDIDKMIEGEIQVLLGLKTEEELTDELAPKEVVEKPKELKDAGRHFNLGMILVERRLFDQARLEFEKAAELDPSNAQAPIELGLLFIRSEMYDEALAQLTRGLELDPESAAGHQAMGLVFLNRGDFEAALDELQWASEISPRDAKIRYQLGEAYETMGDTKKALEQYKKALDMVFKGK